MRIGLIGAGKIGGALTHAFTRVGHEVSISNSRGPETLKSLADETGATATDTRGAVEGADVVVVTIPLKAAAELPKDLFANASDDLVVIDTNNYYPQRDGKIQEIEDGKTEARWVSEQLGHPVVKVFNNIYSVKLQYDGKPVGDPARIALPIAGDDPAAKKVVMDLVEEIGFDAIDAGSIDESWKQQPGTPIYGTDPNKAEAPDRLGAASPERPSEFKG